jgi:hypothetical protein
VQLSHLEYCFIFRFQVLETLVENLFINGLKASFFKELNIFAFWGTTSVFLSVLSN